MRDPGNEVGWETLGTGGLFGPSHQAPLSLLPRAFTVEGLGEDLSRILLPHFIQFHTEIKEKHLEHRTIATFWREGGGGWGETAIIYRIFLHSNFEI